MRPILLTQQAQQMKHKACLMGHSPCQSAQMTLTHVNIGLEADAAVRQFECNIKNCHRDLLQQPVHQLSGQHG